MNRIAIVGIGCRYAGGIDSPDSFWDFVLNKSDGAIADIPADRWDYRRFYDPDKAAAGRMYTKRGAFLHGDPWQFDPEFFGISPREATSMDPQQRLIMEVAWEAADDAGVAGRLSGRPVGVYVGAFNVDVSVTTMAASAVAHIDMNTSTAASFTMLSNRLAYALNLTGPALTVDTACSSSLVAFHLACQGIANGDCEMALAGGVNLMLQPETFVSMCKGGFLAADGRSKPFSALADGYGRGEGAGMVVLRKLDDALRDGDRIYAVVEATGTNQDGRTSAITVPNGDSQEALARSVCARSGIAPHELTYVEAHGTGTPVGDPIELRALGRVYGCAVGRTKPLSVGSLKATLGHTEAASGIAGVIKGALAIYHRMLPPQGWFEDPNPDIPFDELRVSIQIDAAPVDQTVTRMSVAVNGFGYGGTNAHAILAEPEMLGTQTIAARHAARRCPGVFPVSARSEAATRELAGNVAEMLEAGADPDDLIEAAWSRRAHHRHRAAVAFSHPIDLIERLRHVSSGAAPVGSAVDNHAGVAFVFSGMGTQWWAMGRDLLDEGGVFATEAARIDQAFKEIAGWSIVEELRRPEQESRVTSTEIAQPATFLLQVALTRELAEFGITPSAVVGHSMGEVPAAYLSGALSLHDALLVTYHRSRLQATTAGTGGMLAVGLPPGELHPLLRADMDIDVAAINGPSAVTVAGDVVALADLAQLLTERGIFNRTLRVEVPYHSFRMDPILGELRSELAALTPQQTKLPLYSTVTGEAVTGYVDADYWCANVRQPVRFADAITTMIGAGHHIFLEVGPHPALSANIREIVLKGHEPGTAVPTLNRNQRDADSVRKTIAELYIAGALDATDLCTDVAPHVDLPRYPWQRQRLRDELPEFVQSKYGVENGYTMLGDPDLDDSCAWELRVSGQVLPWLADHVVNGACLLPGTAYVDAALSAAATRNGLTSAIAEDIRFTAPLFFNPADGAVLRTEFDETSRRFTIRSRAATGTTWTTHATGRLVQGKCVATKHHVPDPAGMTDIDPADLYAALASSGMTYGTSFRRVTSLRANCTQAVATVDARQDGELTNHLVHPGVVDAALQTISPLIEQSAGRTLGTVVPIGVDAARVFAPFPDRVEVICSVHPADPLRADVVILDSQHVACAQLSGVRFGSLTPGQEPIDRLEPLFYEEVWELCDELDTAALPPAEQTATLVVALGDRPSGRARQLFEALPHATLYHCIDAAELETDLVRLLAQVAQTLPRLHLCVVAGDWADDSAALWLLKQIAIAAELFVRSKGSDPVEGMEALGDDTFYATLVTEQAFSHPGDGFAPNVSHAGLAGARRSLVAEQPRLRWRSIDVGPDTGLGELVSELAVPGAFSEENTDEIILRHGSRWAVVVARTLPRRLETMALPKHLADPDANYAVDIPRSRILADVGWRRCPRPAPGAGQVELQIQVVGLNYKDAVKVVGLLGEKELEGTHFGTELGMEGVGVVTRIGPGVESVQIGDVVTTASKRMLVRYQVADAALCIKLPRSADGRLRPEFCTSMTAFITAECALLELARLKPGETVLIHGAAGGVGQAAIQIAKLCGADVIGTASTNERRSFALASGADYVIDSRSLNFVDDVRELTNGRGADVIISSAPGEILRHNFEALAEFGRIVEVGKADIYANSTLDMSVFDKNLSYFQIDMDRYMAWDSAACIKLEAEIYDKFVDGTYQPLPVDVFDSADLARACEEVFRSSRTSRVAVRLDADTPVKPSWRDVVTDADGTYLITGGHGGFGLATGRWLVRRGARHLTLASRSGATTALARKQIARWRTAGIDVVEESVDMTNAAAVAALVDRCNAGDHPLRGIFHAAGAIADQRIADMDLADLKRVYDVKVGGGRALWSAVNAAGISLDQFVFYSSSGAMLGLLGQYSYAAANVAVQALTESIAHQGQPAICIGWGHMSGAGGGMATDENLARHMVACGVDPIDMDDGPIYLEEALRLGVRQAAIISINWSQLDTVFGHFRKLLRTSAVIAAAAESHSAQDRLRASLSALDEAERGAVVAYMLAEQLATVMGVSTEFIDIDVPVVELGLNSLMAVEFSARTGEAIGVSLNTLALEPSYSLRKAGAALGEAIVSGATK